MAHVITPTFRVSYPNVLQPRLNTLNNKMEYSLVALFKKGESLKVLELEILRAVKEKFGETATITKTPQGLYACIPAPGKTAIPFKNWPLRDQGERSKDGVLPTGYEEGAVFMNLKSKQQPGLVDKNKADIIDPAQFYAGCYARAAVNAYYYDQAGNKGVAFGLGAIQKVADGESLSGRVDPQAAFEPIAEEASTDATSLFGA